MSNEDQVPLSQEELAEAAGPIARIMMEENLAQDLEDMGCEAEKIHVLDPGSVFLKGVFTREELLLIWTRLVLLDTFERRWIDPIEDPIVRH